MARKHNHTGRSKTASRFIMLNHWLLNSPAWRSLSLPARCTFIEIAQLYAGSNNGRLAMSARKIAERLNVSKATAGRCLLELEERGFIEPVREGGFNVKSGPYRATEWRLTLHKCDVTGEAASKKFMRWQGGKIHFTVSPESQPGLTRGTQTDGTQ